METMKLNFFKYIFISLDNIEKYTFGLKLWAHEKIWEILEK